MLCENKLTNLVLKNQENSTKHNLHEMQMHECYAMQTLETKEHKTKKMVTKGRVMKHKDHVRKTQLVRAFCIQNLLDAP